MMLVSVCVTTYNHAAFIEQCLLSILNQKTNFKFEICLGEDDSSDGTREICQKLERHYPGKIRLFLRDRKDVHYINGRATGRYNFFHTLKACKGKYIAIIDGDDYWCDELKLQKSIDILESSPEISLVHHDVAIVDEQGNLNGKTIMPDDFPQITGVFDMVETNRATASSVVMRWFDVDKTQDWFWKTTMGDWPVNLNALKTGRMYAIKDVMSCYRQHSGGIWSSKSNDEIKFSMAKSYRFMLEAGLFNDCYEKALIYYIQLLKSLKYSKSFSTETNAQKMINKELRHLHSILSMTYKEKIKIKHVLRRWLRVKKIDYYDFNWLKSPINLSDLKV